MGVPTWPLGEHSTTPTPRCSTVPSSTWMPEQSLTSPPLMLSSPRSHVPMLVPWPLLRQLLRPLLHPALPTATLATLLPLTLVSLVAPTGTSQASPPLTVHLLVLPPPLVPPPPLVHRPSLAHPPTPDQLSPPVQPPPQAQLPLSVKLSQPVLWLLLDPWPLMVQLPLPMLRPPLTKLWSTPQLLTLPF